MRTMRPSWSGLLLPALDKPWAGLTISARSLLAASWACSPSRRNHTSHASPCQDGTAHSLRPTRKKVVHLVQIAGATHVCHHIGARQHSVVQGGGHQGGGLREHHVRGNAGLLQPALPAGEAQDEAVVLNGLGTWGPRCSQNS